MLLSFPFYAGAEQSSDLFSTLKLKSDVCFYSSQQIKTEVYAYKKTGVISKVLKDVLLPTSMNITVAKFDMSRIDQSQDYIARYNSLMSENDILFAKSKYQDLKSEDMRLWTYGMYEEYQDMQRQQQFASSLTQQHLQFFADKGILLDDVKYLLSANYTLDKIMSLSDSLLKFIITEGYKGDTSGVFNGFAVYIVVINDIQTDITFLLPTENYDDCNICVETNYINYSGLPEKTVTQFKPYRVYKPPLLRNLPLLI